MRKLIGVSTLLLAALALLGGCQNLGEPSASAGQTASTGQSGPIDGERLDQRIISP
jgi:hypothetical protein